MDTIKAKLLSIVLFISMVLCFTSTGYSQVRPGFVSLTPFVGGYLFEGNQSIKHNGVYGLRLGYDLTTRWGVEGVFDYVPTEFKSGGQDLNATLYHVDGLYHFSPDKRMVPFIAAGTGGITLDPDAGKQDSDFLFNYGVGVKYFLSDLFVLRGDVRHILAFNQDKTFNNLEYTLGLSFLLGGEKKEMAAAVVQAPVPAPTPSVDSDKDGVADTLDKCPGTPSGTPVDNNGCPRDSDRDGVVDVLDKCPSTPFGTPVDNNGCAKDSDGDGVVDSLDQCPNTASGTPVDEQGCPIPKRVSIDLNVQFETGKAEVRSQYRENLQQVADFLKRFPETTAEIEGHTDNRGSEKLNTTLSQKRADSVRQYLIDNFNIDPSRITATGYGSSRPIADNVSEEGRTKNRRVVATMTAVSK